MPSIELLPWRKTNNEHILINPGYLLDLHIYNERVNSHSRILYHLMNKSQNTYQKDNEIMKCRGTT